MRFSVITCTYDSEKYLQQNIDSVKIQTCRDFEHVFIDGFSTDRTMEIIEKYRQEFPNQVKVFQFEPKGISNAMNRGIEKANGEYIIHLHSDDSFYSNDVLEKVSEFTEIKNNPDWIYGKINVIEENGSSAGTFPNRKIFQMGKNLFSACLLKFINFIPHQAVFAKKETLKKFDSFDESLKSSMDFDLWLKMRKKTDWIFFNAVISNYRIRPDAQSSGKKNEKENRYDVNAVQSRYMNKMEITLSQVSNYALDKINKTKR